MDLFIIWFVWCCVTTVDSTKLENNIRYFTSQIVINHLDVSEVMRINLHTRSRVGRKYSNWPKAWFRSKIFLVSCSNNCCLISSGKTDIVSTYSCSVVGREDFNRFFSGAPCIFTAIDYQRNLKQISTLICLRIRLY